MKALYAVLAASLIAPIAAASDLGPGSPAPQLDVKSWVKGEPVTALAKDKTYVVEFWATWCGPCIQSIPHLTELAHKNKDVTFIGVSVWEDDKDGSVKKFVDDMGEKMDYHVGYSGNQDGMASSWMKPAAQNGIPAAFIVKNGVIQWIGHPMTLEEPLAQVKAGTFDIQKYKASFEKKAAASRAQMALQKEIKNALDLFDSGKHQEAKTVLSYILTKNPESISQVESIRFQWLGVEDPASWDKKAQELAKSNQPSSLQVLRSYALGQSSDPKGNLTLARKAMELALGASETPEPLTLQYGTIVFEKLKDFPRAIDCANKLLAATPDKPENAEFRKSIEKMKTDLEAKAKSR